MSTSPVRIRRDDKEQLERLQEAIAAASGEKPTQQETLHKALTFIARHRDAFLAEASWTPLSAEDVERWTSKTHDLGDWTTNEIDDIVYGEDA